MCLGAVKKIKTKEGHRDDWGSRKLKCGRKGKTIKRDEAFLIRESKLNPRKASEELHQDIAHVEVIIHSLPFEKDLSMVEEKNKPQKKQLLTALMKKKGIFGQTINWARLLKTGETCCSFGTRTEISFCDNEKLMQTYQAVKQPLKQMF